MQREIAVLFAATALVFGASSVALDGAASEVNAAYEHGTNSAMRYLAAHAGTLRLTLLLQECRLPDLAKTVGRRVPNSVNWFLTGEDAAKVGVAERLFAAQVTRSYLLGYEAGVRTEFRRASPELKGATCGAAATEAIAFSE